MVVDKNLKEGRGNKMTEISLISTEDLMTEVMGRFSGSIFMGVQSRTKHNQDTYYRRWSGGDAVCIGLTDLLGEIIKNDYLKEMENKIE